jgi:hypothetical protein
MIFINFKLSLAGLCCSPAAGAHGTATARRVAGGGPLVAAVLLGNINWELQKIWEHMGKYGKMNLDYVFLMFFFKLGWFKAVIGEWSPS